MITIREADSVLEVCVNVTNGNNITDAGAEIQVMVVDQSTTSNTILYIVSILIVLT